MDLQILNPAIYTLWDAEHQLFKPGSRKSRARHLALLPACSQMSYAEAVGALADAVDSGDQQYGAFVSGVVRWEVPLPRGISALHWLQVSTFLGLKGFGLKDPYGRQRPALAPGQHIPRA